MSPDSITGTAAAPGGTMTTGPSPTWHDAPPRPPAPGGVIYICPMHPEVRQDHAGACPKCGMALEPETPTAGGDEAQSAEGAELRDMTRRLRPARC